MPEASLFQKRQKSVVDVVGWLEFDGSAIPNPGPNCVSAFVLVIGDQTIERSVPIGQGTNNVAEYKALILGMTEALDRGVNVLHATGDSLLVVRGVNRGPRKTGKPHLEKLKAEAIALSERFAYFSLRWIPRKQNRHADRLSKRS